MYAVHIWNISCHNIPFKKRLLHYVCHVDFRCLESIEKSHEMSWKMSSFLFFLQFLYPSLLSFWIVSLSTVPLSIVQKSQNHPGAYSTSSLSVFKAQCVPTAPKYPLFYAGNWSIWCVENLWCAHRYWNMDTSNSKHFCSWIHSHSKLYV